MNLQKILSQIKIKHELILEKSIEIDDIAIDSRLIKKDKNTIFFALDGKNTSGEKFIESAINNGAKIIVSKNFFKSDEIIFIKTENVFEFLVEFLKIFYNPLPSNIYAVTGTNGKTSVAEFTRQILELLEKKSASIGTIGINCDDKIKSMLTNFDLTTPDIVSLYKNLYILKQNKIDDIAIETSSIGLEQGRLNGLNIASAAFTNFTQDHLDYHQNMQNYFDCKMILFKEILPENSCAILNSDIKEFAEIKKICEEKKHKIIDYGFKADTLKLNKINTSEDGQEIIFEYKNNLYQTKINIEGDFQAFNLLCALGLVLSKYDLVMQQLLELLKNFSKIKPALGRMQKVAKFNQAEIYIDFAHSPDALENVLKNARKICKNNLYVLFGCGGNRDSSKRPLMGKIACQLADFVIVTDDNPRKENAKQIRKEILSACDLKKTIEIDDRKIAIEKSIKMLNNGDCLILAGKGHEKYQIIGEIKSEFDEEKIVKNFLKNEIS